MSDKHKKYRCLPGKKRGIVGNNTLWLGKDHLLSVHCYRMDFSENYKRFYYDDIQAIITRKTTTGKICNIVLSVLGGSFMLAFALTSGIWSGFYGVLAGLVIFFLLINWLLGPTCVCHVRTAVQTERLTSLDRLRTARKAINLLKPMIEQVQGALVSETLKDYNNQ